MEYPTYKWGTKLKLGYLAQEVAFEEDQISILEYFMKKHNVTQSEARSELAKALFIRDDVFKKIKVLSGGEKSKLKLCSMTFNKTNFLILDEPTNHLDIDSREVLEEMLLEFDGTILFVSHDRYFIQKIASRVCEISNMGLNYYEGDYDYYKYLKSKETKLEPVKKEMKAIKKKTKPTNNHEKIVKQLESIEKKIFDIENHMKEYGEDPIKLQKLYKEKVALEKQHEEIYLSFEE